MRTRESITIDETSVRAYVLIDTRPGMAASVGKELKEDGIRQADVINGPHNVIAMIQGDTPSDVAILIFKISLIITEQKENMIVK